MKGELTTMMRASEEKHFSKPTTDLRKYAYLYEDMRTKKWTNVL